MSGGKYEWDKWFLRKKFRLRRGRDYACSTTSMVQQVRNQATIRGVRVAVREVDAGVEVRVLPKTLRGRWVWLPARNAR